MKVAVLLYGEYRRFESAHSHWYFLNTLKSYDHKLFISTWNYTGIDDRVVDNTFFTRYLDENTISDISILDKENQTLNFRKTQSGPEHLKTLEILGEHAISIHLKNGIKLIRESNYQPDIVFIMRLDTLYVGDFKNLLTESFEDNTLYTAGVGINADGDVSTEDLYLFGKFNEIEKLANKVNIHDGTETHIYWPKICNELGITIKSTSKLVDKPITPIIVRKTVIPHLDEIDDLRELDAHELYELKRKQDKLDL
jgi:hypothetical protein